MTRTIDAREPRSGKASESGRVRVMTSTIRTLSRRSAPARERRRRFLQLARLLAVVHWGSGVAGNPTGIAQDYVVDLRGRTRGRYTVRIRVRMTRGTFRTLLRYRTCVPRRDG